MTSRDDPVERGTAEANGVTFAYLAAGDRDAPLALCLHGFPDSAWTWRHLLPFLATSGYRAVAPWMRGYAPTTVPPDGRYQSAVLGLDADALHGALGGDERAVLIGHDWGAAAGYAAAHAGAPWRRLVTLAVPPPATIGGAFLTYEQLHRSWYMFLFQHPLAEAAVSKDDMAFIDHLWSDWSPGYDASDDLPAVKEALREPDNLAAAIGYYRAMLSGVGVDQSPEVQQLQGAAAGPPPLATLYLHGRTDGCMGADLAETAGEHLTAEGSRFEMVDGAGHFLHLERPDVVNALIGEFLAEPD